MQVSATIVSLKLTRAYSVYVHIRDHLIAENYVLVTMLILSSNSRIFNNPVAMCYEKRSKLDCTEDKINIVTGDL